MRLQPWRILTATPRAFLARSDDGSCLRLRTAPSLEGAALGCPADGVLLRLVEAPAASEG